MTNRQKLLKTSEYELLCRMNREVVNAQDRILECSESPINICIIDAITGDLTVCPDADRDTIGYKSACDACIAAWLNSEYDGRW